MKKFNQGLALLLMLAPLTCLAGGPKVLDTSFVTYSYSENRLDPIDSSLMVTLDGDVKGYINGLGSSLIGYLQFCAPVLQSDNTLRLEQRYIVGPLVVNERGQFDVKKALLPGDATLFRSTSFVIYTSDLSGQLPNTDCLVQLRKSETGVAFIAGFYN